MLLVWGTGPRCHTMGLETEGKKGQGMGRVSGRVDTGDVRPSSEGTWSVGPDETRTRKDWDPA